MMFLNGLDSLLSLTGFILLGLACLRLYKLNTSRPWLVTLASLLILAAGALVMILVSVLMFLPIMGGPHLDIPHETLEAVMNVVGITGMIAYATVFGALACALFQEAQAKASPDHSTPHPESATPDDQA